MFEKVRNFVAILTNIAKKDKKPKIFVALMNDIATRRDCDIIATLSVATISQPCGSRYIDNIRDQMIIMLISLQKETSTR